MAYNSSKTQHLEEPSYFDLSKGLIAFRIGSKLDVWTFPTDPLANCDRAIRYSGLGVRAVGPVGDFFIPCSLFILIFTPYHWENLWPHQKLPSLSCIPCLPRTDPNGIFALQICNINDKCRVNISTVRPMNPLRAKWSLNPWWKIGKITTIRRYNLGVNDKCRWI